MKQKDLLTILIPLFILTVLWVVFNIYHNYVTSTIEDPLTFQIIPIEGKFDTNAVDKIKNRQKINPVYESQVQANLSETPTPSPTKSDEQVASDSAEVTPVISEEASQ